MDECRHGFEAGMCATCFPPPEPTPRPVVTAVRTQRTTTSLRGTTTRVSSRPPARVPGTRAAQTFTPIDPKTVRIYHVTHVENLASIFGAGAILADTTGAQPEVDLSAPAAREFRRSAPVAGTDHVVADYVPFMLSTDAHVWEALRTGSPDPRLDPSAATRPASDHVLFVTSIEKAVGARTEQVGAVAVSGTDVATAGSVTDSAWPDVLRTLQRIHRDDDGAQLASAEFLVHDALPLERVLLIAVGNDRVRDRVRAVLDTFDLRTRVAVHPPYFQPGGGAAGDA